MLSKILKNYLFLVVGFLIAFTCLCAFSLMEVFKTHSDNYEQVTGTVLDTWSVYTTDALEYHGRVGFTMNNEYYETVLTNVNTEDGVIVMWVPKDFTGDSRRIVTERDISSYKFILEMFGIFFLVTSVIFFLIQISIYRNKK